VAVSPVASVVIPTINSLHYLKVTVRAILEQSMDDLELIVVDEASTDGTAEWLDAHPDPRVRVIHHERPMGACQSRNDGIAAATGEWIGFCDHDDVWAPTKLEKQIDAMRRHGAGWSSVTSYVFDHKRRIVEVHRVPRYNGDIAAMQLYRNLIPGGGSAVVAHRDAVARSGGFAPTIQVMGDWDGWTRLALVAPFQGVDEPLIGYRQTATGMSASMWPVPDIYEMKRRYADERAKHDVDFDEYHQLWWAYLSYCRTPARRKIMRVAWEMVKHRVESPSFLAQAAVAATFSDRYKQRREAELAASHAARPVPTPDWLHALLDTADDGTGADSTGADDAATPGTHATSAG
jgi:glycosyltransferase involved in cell wall biosynthesis